MAPRGEADILIVSKDAKAEATVSVSFTATSSTVNHTDNDVTKAIISTDADGATIDLKDATGVYTLKGGAGVDKLTGSAGVDTINGAGVDIITMRLVILLAMRMFFSYRRLRIMTRNIETRPLEDRR